MTDVNSSVVTEETVDTTVTEETTGQAAPEETNAEGAESESEESQPATGEPDAEKQHEENERWKARRIESEEKGRRRAMSEIDKWAVETFGSAVNPVTGKPIASFADYQQAVAAQREVRRNARIAEDAKAGKDISELIKEAVQEAPAVREANEWLEQQKQEEQDRKNIAALDEILKIDPSLNGDPHNIVNIAELNDFNELCEKGIDPVKAYRYACMERLSKSVNEKREAAVRQQAINDAKGAGHVKATATAQAGGEEITIPADKMAFYRDQFPDKTDEQLNKLWAKTH